MEGEERGICGGSGLVVGKLTEQNKCQGVAKYLFCFILIYICIGFFFLYSFFFSFFSLFILILFFFLGGGWGSLPGNPGCFYKLLHIHEIPVS